MRIRKDVELKSFYMLLVRAEVATDERLAV